jgi:hypothetical protein
MSGDVGAPGYLPDPEHNDWQRVVVVDRPHPEQTAWECLMDAAAVTSVSEADALFAAILEMTEARA